MKKIRSFLGVVAGVLVTALLLGLLDQTLILKRHDGILTMKAYYVQEKTPDVLILGSSHAGMQLDVGTMWAEQGIAAYDLWAAAQPLWNSYHNLVECLKTGTPRLVVLEVLATMLEEEYSDEDLRIRSTAGMRLSLNKWETICASAPPEGRLNLLLELPLFHTRFNQLHEGDYSNYAWSQKLAVDKGSTLSYGNSEYPIIDVSGDTRRQPLPEKQQRYLEKIVTLCKEKNIPLLLLKTPSSGIEREQPYYNTVADLAKEWDVPFVNTNLLNDEIGIEACDHLGDGHMNGAGARKVGHWLGAWLKQNYDLPDRRGQEGYSSWDTFYKEKNIDYLLVIRGIDTYVREVAERGYRAELHSNGETATLPESLQPLQKLALPVQTDDTAEPGYTLTVYLDSETEPVDTVQFLQANHYAMSRGDEVYQPD